MIRLVLAIVLLAGVAHAAEPPPLTREQIEQIVRESLIKNPDVVTDALRAAEVKRRETAQRETQQAIVSQREQLLRDATSPVGGNVAGDVTVVEFFDYACPHCKAVDAAVKQLLRDDPKVRLVYKELPLLGEPSVTAARAALAAREQGKYYAFHDALMASTMPLSDPVVYRIAAQVGLNVDRLKTDMASAAVTNALKKNYTLAEAIGVNGTPAFVIGDELVPGGVPLARLKQLVARARQPAR
jgi:protein-disulfide isomerase